MLIPMLGIFFRFLWLLLKQKFPFQEQLFVELFHLKRFKVCQKTEPNQY